MKYLRNKSAQFKQWILSIVVRSNSEEPYFFEQITNKCMKCGKPLNTYVKYINGEFVMCKECANV